MALQIGDKVKFLNDEGGGEITQLIDKDTVMVLSEIDDFEIPMLIRELIPMNRGEVVEKQVDMSNVVDVRMLAIKKTSIIFAEKEGDFNCYIYNGGNAALVCGVFEEKEQEISGVFSGMLQPNSVQKLETYSLKNFEKVVQWRVQGFYFEKYPKVLSAPLDCNIKMHPKKFFGEGNKKFIDEIGADGIIVPLEGSFEDISLKPDDLFASVPELQQSKPKKVERVNTEKVLEVDLHINELLESTKGMTAGEMLEYQMDTFRKILEENKNFKGKKLIFIHGVGNGVLKQRIRHELQKHPRCIVQDASFQEYGWGATMVIIK